MTLDVFFNFFETHFIVHKTSDDYVSFFIFVKMTQHRRCIEPRTAPRMEAFHGHALFSFLSSPFSVIDFDHVPPEFSSLQAARASVQGLFSPTVAPPLIISSWVLGP